jgi:hypothetical protein
MYLIKKLTTAEEYAAYDEHFMNSHSPESRSKTKPVGDEYFKKSLVFGLFNEQQEMVAGYILGMSPEFRLMRFIPQENLSETLSKFNLSDCCEIVCVWKKKSVSKADTARYLWPSIFKDFLETNKPFLLGHNQNQKLDKHYGIFTPKTLYHGLSTQLVPSRLFIYSRCKIQILYFFSKYIMSVYLSLKSKGLQQK